MSTWTKDDLPAIPDFTEPLRLFRTWRYSADASFNIETGDYTYIYGVYASSHDYVWKVGENTAECARPLFAKMEAHESPRADCKCGFYGYHLPTQPNEFANICDYVGVIEGYGRVIPHMLGARVGKARIVAIAATQHAGSGAAEFLPRVWGATDVDVFTSDSEMYEKYPPLDVTAILGMSAEEATAKYDEIRIKRMDEERARIHAVNGPQLGCPCPLCRQQVQGCGDPNCNICWLGLGGVYPVNSPRYGQQYVNQMRQQQYYYSQPPPLAFNTNPFNIMGWPKKPNV